MGIYQASISTEHGVLPELYDPDSEADGTDSTRVVKYLQAKDGANFSVHFQLSPGYKFRASECVAVDIYLDGQRMVRPVIPKDAYEDGRNNFAGYSKGALEGKNSAWTLRRFKFGGLKLCKKRTP